MPRQLPGPARPGASSSSPLPVGSSWRWPGRLEQIGRGLYQRTDIPASDPDLSAAALRAPRSTLCLRSALSMHGLSDDIPAAHDLGTRLS